MGVMLDVVLLCWTQRAYVTDQKSGYNDNGSYQWSASVAYIWSLTFINFFNSFFDYLSELKCVPFPSL